MRRRELLGAVAAAGLAAALPACAQTPAAPIARRGRIKQGLWRINFGQGFADDGPLTFEDMCREAARLGVHGFDLVQFDDIPTLQRHGLKLLLAGPGEMDFLTGVIHPEVHDRVAAALTAQADLCAQHGVPGIASNAGQLRGLSYAQAADNAVEVLNRVKDHLEARGVAIYIENVNDRRPDEPSLGREDMAFGRWDWGMEVAERVNSPGVKLLCDIYHLQIMDGDVARRIRDSIPRIGHFHVAGVPTRTEIDETQELNYRYIAEVIAGLDYDGYVSHEWRPSPGRDPLESLAQAVEIMDV
jgi:hydroxypyruvate isomerase